MESDAAPRHTNRLIHAASPYLRQHAHNPVDWHEWGPEALALAREQDRPIHLSVGYAACHWCHVLAHESFEDERTAALLNAHFINIKVDREERPDIDSIYMTALQAMTRSGGWPMTMFLTPEGVPFYGGTYFPPEERYGMPSFTQVILGVADAWQRRRDEVEQNSQALSDHLRSATAARMPEGPITPALLDDAYASLHGQFDQDEGGFGRAPKFPQPMTYEFLLRYAQRTGTRLAWDMLALSLHKMAEGGIYDQLGGGFHRYSVDGQWLVPHFEKMLYDNALLARVYTEAYQATSDPLYCRVAEQTLDYVARELRHPEGGFYSTQDADSLPTPQASHAEEGAFFVWGLDEVRAALGPDAMAFAAAYDVTQKGNFEGRNILHVLRQPDEVAGTLGIPPHEIAALLGRGRRTLFELRERRPRPGLDNKVLASWNGMALRAFAQAAGVFGREDYLAHAERCAAFVLGNMRDAEGRLLRAWKDGQAGATPGFLEDHALLADGLLALYEATLDPRWLAECRALAEVMLAEFWDDNLGGFYDTAARHEALIARPRDTGDNATPSGNAAAAELLLKLAVIYDQPRYRERAMAVLGGMAQLMGQYPTGFGRYLAAAEFALAPTQEIALVGDPDAEDTKALREVIATRFLPNKVLVLRRPDEAAPTIASPLLDGREQLGGRATAYVCRSYACQMPVTEPDALVAQLQA
ncbi:thioredoxin domain-containing protein [Chloroflexia bacterium SDU3-3]|nr:thioredoxin domain-containing protein [Chloroflexia bacterium SDU3-3]